MGTLIGKGGSIIKSIQDASGSRLNASEEPLPMSTERTISIQGTPSAIQQAIQRIAKILIEQSDRPTPHLVLYRPVPMHSNNRGNNNGYMNMRNNNNPAAAAAAAAAMGYGGMMPMGGMPMNNSSQFYYGGGGGGGPGGSGSATVGGYSGMPNSRQNDYGMGAMSGMGNMGAMGAMGAMGNMSGMSGMTGSSQAQQIFIPNEMVSTL